MLTIDGGATGGALGLGTYPCSSSSLIFFGVIAPKTSDMFARVVGRGGPALSDGGGRIDGRGFSDGGGRIDGRGFSDGGGRIDGRGFSDGGGRIGGGRIDGGAARRFTASSTSRISSPESSCVPSTRGARGASFSDDATRSLPACADLISTISSSPISPVASADTRGKLDSLGKLDGLGKLDALPLSVSATKSLMVRSALGSCRVQSLSEEGETGKPADGSITRKSLSAERASQRAAVLLRIRRSQGTPATTVRCPPRCNFPGPISRERSSDELERRRRGQTRALGLRIPRMKILIALALPLVALPLLALACHHDPQPDSQLATAPQPLPTTSFGPTADAAIWPTTPAPTFSAAPPSSGAPAPASTRSTALPGAAGSVSVEHIGYDAPKNRVWIPVGDTGSVDVLDVASGSFARVDGFKTAVKDARGQKRTVGPSAVAFGDGVAYVGNRATNEVCVVDAATLALGACARLPASIDEVAYVAATKQVWVTMPRDHSLAILDAAAPASLKPVTTIRVDGEPQGAAVDDAHGLFYTSLEDKDRTIAIDLKTHAIKPGGPSDCGRDGPRGIAVDSARNLVIVGCTDGLRLFDAAHSFMEISKIDTGAGTESIDYDPKTKSVVVASGIVARVTVFRVDKCTVHDPRSGAHGGRRAQRSR